MVNHQSKENNFQWYQEKTCYRGVCCYGRIGSDQMGGQHIIFPQKVVGKAKHQSVLVDDIAIDY